MKQPTTEALKGRWRKAFLSTFAKTGNVSAACKAAGISRATAYKYQKEDEEFAREWQESLDHAADALEREAWRRATEGYPEPKFYQGKVCGTVTLYSDNLLMFLLKGMRPEKFREQVTLSSTELDRLIERELKKLSGATEEPEQEQKDQEESSELVC